MTGRRLPWILIASAALSGATQAPAWAAEPSARELAALAPVLESSDRGCRSLDIGGYLGGVEGPRLRFRAFYRAPDRFSLLVSDASDGTPLAFCSGRKMLIYDPVRPVVYYSERGGFELRMAYEEGKIEFKVLYLLIKINDSRISLDLSSLLSDTSIEGHTPGDTPLRDEVVKINNFKFKLSRIQEDSSRMTWDIDLEKKCPYTAVTFTWGNSTILTLDRIVLNGTIGDEAFAFPAKERLARSLPLRDVTMLEKLEESRDMAAVVGRAGIVRATVNQAIAPEAIEIPGFEGFDWGRVKENDKKYAKVLRGLVPPTLRAR